MPLKVADGRLIWNVYWLGGCSDRKIVIVNRPGWLMQCIHPPDL